MVEHLLWEQRVAGSNPAAPNQWLENQKSEIRMDEFINKNKTYLTIYKPPVIVILLSVLIFYIWTATDFVNPFTQKLYSKSPYNLLTDSILKGKLYLSTDPPKELFGLKNPYDINERKLYNIKIHDVSFYGGKLFMYHGISPVILLYAPFKALTGLDMPDSIACTLFMFGSFLFSVILLMHIKEKYFQEIPEWMALLSFVVLGLCNIAPFMLRRPVQYEVAISSGCFLITAAVYFLINYLSNKHDKYLLLCSLSLGFAIGARPSLVFGSILLIVFSVREIKEKILFCLIPFISLMVLQFTYNYLRFNSVFEFGQTYAIGLVDYTKNIPFSVQNIFQNLQIYLTKPILFSHQFPFIFLPLWGPDIVKNIWPYEKMAGILTSIPFTNIIFLCIIFLLVTNLRTYIKFPKKEIMILIIPTVANFVTLLLFHYQTYRYLADFMTFLLIITIIFWFYTDLKLKSKPQLKNFLNLTVTILSTVSIVFSLSFSLIGYFGG